MRVSTSSLSGQRFKGYELTFVNWTYLSINDRSPAPEVTRRAPKHVFFNYLKYIFQDGRSKEEEDYE